MKSLCCPGMEVTSWVFKISFQSHRSENIFSSHFLLPNCSAAAFGFGFSAFICYCFSSIFSPHPSYLNVHFCTVPVLFVLNFKHLSFLSQSLYCPALESFFQIKQLQKTVKSCLLPICNNNQKLKDQNSFILFLRIEFCWISVVQFNHRLLVFEEKQ